METSSEHTKRLLISLTDRDVLGRKVDKGKRLVCMAKEKELLMACYLKDNYMYFFRKDKFYLREKEVKYLSQTVDDVINNSRRNEG